MFNPNRFFLFVSAVALAACSSDNNQPSMPSQPVTPPATLATLAIGTNLTLTPHKGLEVVDSNFAVTSSPIGAYTTTSIGFNLTIPDGRIAVYDTRANASDITGPNQYKACVTNCDFHALPVDTQVETVLTSGTASQLTYSTYGVWTESDATGVTHHIMTGVFATGIDTSQMPTTGSATYSGGVAGAEFLGVPDPNTTFDVGKATNTFTGSINLTANFGSNTISGAVTNVNITGAAGQAMNNVNLTGGTITGTSFTGTAAAAAATAGTTVNIAGTTGQFGGKFYGPGAAEAAGTLALTNGSAGATQMNVTASFGAHK